MEDFLHRTISKHIMLDTDDGKVIRLGASRTRTSAGFQGITIKFGEQEISFCDPVLFEEHARALLRLLDEVCNNPCSLPKMDE